MDVVVLPGCAALQSFRQLTAQTVYRRIIHSMHLHTVSDMTDDDAESPYQTSAFGKEWCSSTHFTSAVGGQAGLCGCVLW